MLLVLALALGAASTAGAQGATKVYKWTDQNGRVQYSSTPPPEGEAKEMNVRSAPATPVAPKPEEEAKPDPEAERKEGFKRNCETARANLAQFQQPGQLMTPKPDGTMTPVSDAERQAGVAQAQKDIAYYCTPESGG
jgi:hypothetical protein